MVVFFFFQILRLVLWAKQKDLPTLRWIKQKSYVQCKYDCFRRMLNNGDGFYLTFARVPYRQEANTAMMIEAAVKKQKFKSTNRKIFDFG